MENRPKANKICKIWISVYIIKLSYVYILCMNTFILHQVAHTTVSNVQPNFLIYQQPQLEQPHFV